MPANKGKAKLVDVQAIDEQFGEFAVSSYSESVYPAVYYALREVMSLKLSAAMRQKNQRFDYKAFNEKFAEVMGEVQPEKRKFTIEQLVQYAVEKTGHNLESLLEINKKSWERRKNRQSLNNSTSREELIEDEF